jgi:hypothetical protein
MSSLKNTGSAAPLKQTDCFKHNSYWLNFWENCGDSIDANLLKGKNKEQIKKMTADKCCKEMVCRGRDQWLKENNLYSCKHTDVQEPNSPHFGAKKEGNFDQNENAKKITKRLYMGI